MLSVNRNAWKLVEKLSDGTEKYGIKIKRATSGATIIDAGINCPGGFLAGKKITEICLGGLGKVSLFMRHYGDIELPSILVHTDHPSIATLSSQLAGWQIKTGDYFAIGSGPARALAMKPRVIYEKIGYKDDADVAVVVLETDKEPPESITEQISKECKVPLDHMAIILVPTASPAGSTQISGRVVETGMHKLMELGLDPNLVTHAWGYAPIAPIHPKFAEAMSRTNDAILYAGVTYYVVSGENDKKLEEIVSKAPSNTSKSYGKPFIEIFKEAKYDFYKIDPNLFAPAVITVNSTRTGKVFKAGEININVLKQSISLKNSNKL